MAQPHWRDGGAVNAIEKMAVVLEAIRALREEWRGRSDQRHPHLSPGDIVPAMHQRRRVGRSPTRLAARSDAS